MQVSPVPTYFLSHISKYPSEHCVLNTSFLPDNESSFIRVLTFPVCGSPAPQSQHGQPQAGSPSTPDPGAGITKWGGTGGKDWRRGDPKIFNRLWKSKTPLGKMKQRLHNSVTRQAYTNSGHQVAWRQNCVEWRLILLVLRMEPASCHASGAKNFEMVPSLIEKKKHVKVQQSRYRPGVAQRVPGS